MMSTTTEQQVRELGKHWAAAEVRGDTETLNAISVDDFTLVGPLGFVLNKDQWVLRYRAGQLVTIALTWDEITVRDYGDTAIAIGRHTQQATFEDHPADGSFRATHVMVRRDDEWRLASMHLSPIGGPPPFAARPARPG